MNEKCERVRIPVEVQLSLGDYKFRAYLKEIVDRLVEYFETILNLKGLTKITVCNFTNSSKEYGKIIQRSIGKTTAYRRGNNILYTIDIDADAVRTIYNYYMNDLSKVTEPIDSECIYEKELIYHELIHVNDYNHMRGVGIWNGKFKTIYENMLFKMWMEYNATRRSSLTGNCEQKNIEAQVQTIRKLDDDLLSHVKNSGKNFMRVYEDYSQDMCEKFGYLLGEINRLSEKRARKKMFRTINKGIKNHYVRVMLKRADSVLGDLYQQYPKWEVDNLLDHGKVIIEDYINNHLKIMEEKIRNLNSSSKNRYPKKRLSIFS